MDDKLRILILEDVASDAELVERELRGAGLAFDSRRVDTRKDFVDALEDFHPNIVLADYELPQFDGMSALKLTLERCPTIPVVVVTGSIDEETAVECIKSGAADYVLKTHLARLAPAVQNALERVRDREERLVAERALRESEVRYRELVEDSQGLLCVHDLHGRLLALNPAAARSLGYEPSEAIGRNLAEFLVPDTRSEFSAYLTRIKEQGSDDGLLRVVTKTGVERTWAYRNVLQERSGQEPYVLGHALDITERERAQEVLRTSESGTRLLKEVAIAANEAKGADEALLVALERVCAFTKWPVGHVYVPARDGTKNLAPTKLWHLDDPERFGVFKEVTERTHFAPGIGLPGRVRATGQPAWIVDVTKDPNFPRAKLAKNIGVRGAFAFPVLVEKEVVAVLEFFSAVTEAPNEALLEIMAQIGVQLGIVMERQRAEEALRGSEKQYRDLVETSNDLIWSVDADGCWTFLNRQAAKRIWGYDVEEMLGRPITEFQTAEQAAEDLKAVGRIKAGESVFRYETVHLHKDKSPVRLSFSAMVLRDEQGNVIGATGTASDITERFKLEAQLRQAQKMEAVGQLTGGIAHDFNNLLSIILLNTQAVAAALESTAPQVLPDLDDIEQAARRAAAMTKRLLGFSRRMDLAPVPTDIARLVTNFKTMLRPVIPEHIELRIKADDPVGAVMVDPGAVEQCVINLVTNARDAMPEGGDLLVEVGETELGEAYRETHPWITPGPHVCVSISDTGIGMDESTKAKIFEPFFTTKGPDAGTGLGMAMVYGLTKQQAGHVHVYSEPGEGTTIRLCYPIIEAPAQASAGRQSSTVPMTGGTETILLVEDEDLLRRAGKRVLERYGYTVITAADGAEALEVWRARRAEIDLVLSDMVMPRMSGAELYRYLEKEPDTPKFILASGYPDRDIRSRVGLDPSVPMVRKPWDIQELLMEVREALDGEGGKGR